MTLDAFNHLPGEERHKQLFNCCGSKTWAGRMMVLFPFASLDSLLEAAADEWQQCGVDDWMEAFGHHPKIGDIASLEKKFASTAAIAGGEQSSVRHATPETLQALAAANTEYEARFGFIFIVCATGKSAVEMLELLQDRLNNSRDAEIVNAMREQQKITALRLQKIIS
jgi:2-oxo-4-hydroxy-4-carboxy-5-ureidoimidazoline decarboxylase